MKNHWLKDEYEDEFDLLNREWWIDWADVYYETRSDDPNWESNWQRKHNEFQAKWGDDCPLRKRYDELVDLIYGDFANKAIIKDGEYQLVKRQS